MKSVCRYPYGYLGSRELKRQRAQASRERIEEYLQNLLVQQAIIWTEGTLREKYFREPKVRF